MQLELAFLDELLDFLGQLALDAVAHLDQLLDLVAANLLGLVHVEEAHIDIALGELVAQDVLDLLQLEFGIAEQRDFLVLDFDGGGCALEVEARADLLGGVFHGVLHFNKVGFTDGIKRRHGITLGKRGEPCPASGRVRQSDRC